MCGPSSSIRDASHLENGREWKGSWALEDDSLARSSSSTPPLRVLEASSRVEEGIPESTKRAGEGVEGSDERVLNEADEERAKGDEREGPAAAAGAGEGGGVGDVVGRRRGERTRPKLL